MSEIYNKARKAGVEVKKVIRAGGARVAKTLSLDEKVYDSFVKYCEKNGQVPSRVIDLLMLEFLNANITQ